MKKLFDNKQNSRFILEELEPRQLFSAGIEGLLINELELPIATYIDVDDSGEQISTKQDHSSKTSAAEKQIDEIVFVDTNVENYQSLVDDVLDNADSSRHIEVVILNTDQNGIDQISDTLLEHDNLEAIHIISHGSDGSVQLGNTYLTTETLTENNLAISLWADSFAKTGDILIYGCNLAETEVGQNLISRLSEITLTDVAGSNDLTGHTTLGGDWELEYTTGTIETFTAISSQTEQTWSSSLVNTPPVGLPIIIGAPTEDLSLTVDTSDISDDDGLPGSFSYQWLQNGVLIAGAGSSTYTLGDDDVGKNISVMVTYTDNGGTKETLVSAETTEVNNVNDAPAGSVALTDTSPSVGDTATINNTLADADGISGGFTYQWKINTVDISEATASTYTPIASDLGKQLTVTVSYTDDHNTLESSTTASLTVSANTNSAPSIASIESNAFTYTENDAATTITSTLTISDDDDTNIESAVIVITGNNANNEDILTFADTSNISGSWDQSAGTLTLSGTDTLLNYQAALQSVSYKNTSENPSAASRTVSFTINDGSVDSNTLTRDIAIASENDAPIATNDHPFLSFDGIDDMVQIADHSSLQMTNTMTMEAWVKPTANNTYQIVVNKEGEYQFAVKDGTLQWGFSNTDPNWSWHDTGHAVTVDEWMHVAITYDNGTIKTYANGSLIETYVGSGSINDVHPTLNDFLIGGRLNSPSTKYFEGQIADVRIWNTVRSQAEINSSNDLTGTETGLVGYWRLNDEPGTTVADSSSQTNTGILGGGSLDQTPSWSDYTIDEDTTLTITTPGLLQNDVDPDGDPLTVNTTPISNVSNGTITLHTDGSFEYTPNENFSGTDSFTYQISDGTETDTATVTITINSVNDAPTFTLGNNQLVAMNSGTHAIPNFVTANSGGSTDEDGQTFSYSITNNSNDALFLVDPVIDNTGQLSYTLAIDWTGTATMTVSVQDNGGTDNGGADTSTQTFTITVGANTAPTLTATPIGGNTTYYSGDPARTLFSSTDIDTIESNQTIEEIVIRISGVLSDTDEIINVNGTAVSLNIGNDVSVAGDTYIVSSNSGDTILTLTMPGTSVADAETLIDGLTYQHNNTATQGSREFELISITDSGGAETNNPSVEVTLTVEPQVVNTVPTASNSSVTTDEDSSYSFQASDFNFSDTDSGDTLTSIKITALENAGSLRFINGASIEDVTINQVISVADITAGNLVFVPDADANGSSYASFEFSVSDGTDNSITYTMTIDVDAVIDVPNARNDQFLNFDGDGDRVLVENDPSLIMTTNITMEAWINPTEVDTSGNESFLIINKEGEYEVAVRDGRLQYAFAGADNRWSWTDPGLNITANKWTHIAVSYDNGIIKTYIDGVLVNTTNEAGSIGDALPDEDKLTIGGRLNISADSGAFKGQISDVRVWSTTRSDLQISSNQNRELTGSESGLAGYWKLNEGAGTTVTDSSSHNNTGSLGSNGLPDSGTPTWSGYTVDEDGTLTVTASMGLLRNDYDVDGDALTVITTAETEPSNGTLTLQADGSFTYTPNANFNGTDSFSYQISDGAETDTATVTITVNPDTPPKAIDDQSRLAFDGINDRVFIADDNSLDMTTNVTMEAWINPTAIDSTDDNSRMIISKEGEYQIAIKNGTLQFGFADTGDSTYAWHDTGYAIDLNKWTHIAISFDNGIINTYVDGILIEENYSAAGSDGSITSLLLSEEGLTIGHRLNTSTTSAFQGQITDVRVWNTTRTATEINTNKNQVLTGGEAGLVGYWKLDEATGVTAINSSTLSPKAPNGSIENGLTWSGGYSVDEDNTLTVDAANGVLQNDFVPSGSTVSLVSDVSNGTLSAQPDGSFTYTPNANFNGTDSFSYQISDGAEIDTATVNILVNAVNDAPTDLFITQYIAGSEFIVNSHTTNIQDTPAVTTLTEGGFVVVWESLDQDGDHNGIYFQRYDDNGNTVGVETQVNTTTSDRQDDPKIAALSNGGFVIVWESNLQDGSDFGNYGRIFDASGTAVTTEFLINTTTDNIQQDPIVSSLNGGGFVVAWESNLQDGDLKGIYSQRFNNNGVAQGSEFKVNTTTTGSQLDPRITALNNGGYIVAWDNKTTDNTEVMGQRFNATGGALGNEFQINTTTTQTQDDSTVIALSGGGFVAVWESTGQDGSGEGLFGQRFDDSGNPVVGEFQINTTTQSDQRDPAIVSLEEGGFIVSWTSRNQDGDSNGVYAQQFDALANKVNGEFQINATTANSQANSALTMLQDGRMVAIYESDQQDGSGDTVVGRIYTPTLDENSPIGTLVAVTSQVVDPDTGDSHTFSLVNDAGGAFTINNSGEIRVADSALINFEASSTLSIIVRVLDSGNQSHDETVTISIKDVNEAPTTTPVTLTAISEDSGIRVITQAELLSNANDAENDNLTAIGLAISGAGLGALSDNGDGTWNYIPSLNDASSVSFNYSISDGNETVAATTNLDITAVNDSPSIDLDADDSSSATGVDYNLAWTQGSGSVLIADTDAILNDVEGDDLTSLTVTITNLRDGANELLSVDTSSSANISANYDSTTGVLTLSGSDTATNYQQVLRTISYNNTHLAPYSETRIIEFVANDGTDTSATATTNLSLATDFGVLIVTNTLDTVNGDITSIDALIANSGTDGISLREAIRATNNSANGTGSDVIRFEVGAGVQTINISSALPAITDKVNIDGRNQAGEPSIELNGENAGNASGLALNTGSDGSSIQGLIINRFELNGLTIQSNSNIIIGNIIGTDVNNSTNLGNHEGIQVSGDNNVIGSSQVGDRNIISGNNDDGINVETIASGTSIKGNFIGVDSSGYATLNNGFNGVSIKGDNTQVGGVVNGEGNVISGNTFHGIYISGNSANSNIIQGNLIGTDKDGVSDLGNYRAGVLIQQGASNNVIGGSVAGSRNIISGNNANGIKIATTTSLNNKIQGNYIGTDINGTADIGNGLHGVLLLDSVGTLIGGSTVDARNIISGNNSSGIGVLNAGSTANIIQGNYIGTDVSGNNAIANTLYGVRLVGSDANTIKENLISANNTANINLEGGADNNIIQGNKIGLNAQENGYLASNFGIRIEGGSNNLIGGIETDKGNKIAGNNFYSGVAITGTTDTGNSILGNLIYHDDIEAGIDLGDAGITANDSGDSDSGSNNLQNFPILDAANSTGSDITITGSLNSTAGTTYRIEFFASDTQGEAERYLGFITINTNDDGDTTFNKTLNSVVTTGEFVTATATVELGNGNYGDTSEFASSIVANNIPILSSIEGGTLTYTENNPTTAITTSIIISDVNETHIESAIIEITGGYQEGEDSLAFIDSTGIVSTWDASNGRLTLTGSVTLADYETALRNVTYQNSSDSPSTINRTLSFTVNDGDIDSNTLTREMSLSAVNDAPVNSIPNTAQVIDEDKTLTFSSTNGNAISISDIDANDSSIKMTITAYDNATISFSNASGLVPVLTSTTPDIVNYDLTGTVAQINTELEGMTFSSANNFNGTTSIRIKTQDLGNTGDGNLTDSDVITINITPVNDTSIIRGITIGTVQEDNTVVNNSISAIGSLTISDVDTGEDSFIAETIIGTYGNLSIAANGDWTYIADNTQPTIQALDDNESLTDTIQISAFDGTTHNIVLTISGTDDLAVIGGTFTGSVTEDGTLTSAGTLTITDTDSSDPSNFANITPQTSDNGYGTFEITNNNWTFVVNNTHASVQALDSGETLIDTYTFTAPDGVTQPVTVTINGAEDNPVFDSTAVTVATEDSLYSYTISTSDTDVETLTITASTLPDWLTLTDNNDGTAILTGTPDNTEVGNHNIVLNVSDGSVNSNQSFTITVANSNEAPTVNNPITDQSASEGSPFNFQFADNVFADVDTGDSLTYTSNASGWLTFDAATRTFSGTPLNTDIGITMVIVTASDGNGGSISDSFNIVIEKINQSPVIEHGIKDLNTSAESFFSFTFPSNTFVNPNTTNNINLTYTATLQDGAALPNWLTFDTANRTFSGTPNNSDVGSISIKLSANNGSSSISTNFILTVINAPASITVTGIDTGAVTENKPFTTGELTISSHSSFIAETIFGAHGKFTIEESGIWSYSLYTGQDKLLQLAQGENINSIFQVSTTDGFTHDIIVSINGITETDDINNSFDETFYDSGPYFYTNMTMTTQITEITASVSPSTATEQPNATANKFVSNLNDEITQMLEELNSVSLESSDNTSWFDRPEYELDSYSTDYDEDESKSAQKSQKQKQNQGLKNNLSSRDNLTTGKSNPFDENEDQALWNKIDNIRDQMDDSAATDNEDIDVKIALGSSIGLTAGVVSWFLRGGALLASFMSSIPFLNRFDPVPILKSKEKKPVRKASRKASKKTSRKSKR